MNKVEKLIPGGQALSSLADGKKIFFWNALPGEIVTEFTITKNKSHYAEAIATKIEKPSPYRINPKDECYLSTSPWQIMDYSYELDQKTEIIKEVFKQNGFNFEYEGRSEAAAVRPLGRVRKTQKERRAPVKAGCADVCPSIKIKPILTDNHDFHYRNKMEYALFWDNDEQKIKLAFHQRGSHRKIPITNSSIERPEIFQKAKEIIDNLNINHEEARKYQSLLLRCNQQGIVSGGLYENGKPHPIFDNLTDTILNHEYSYSPNGFFQINLPVYELALKEIAKHINTEKVLDLYAGVGTIGLSVARDKDLTLVECDKYAFAELDKNCKMDYFCDRSEVATVRPLGRVRKAQKERRAPVKTGCADACRKNNPLAILSNSEDALDYIAPDETVILDPPRAGCHIKLLEKLLEQTPPTIIYLSCNPATQARDIKILSEKYQTTHIQPFNFFPRTPHIENLVVLKHTK